MSYFLESVDWAQFLIRTEDKSAKSHKPNRKMWLRSEKRSRRSSQTKTSMNLRKIIKELVPAKRVCAGRKNLTSSTTMSPVKPAALTSCQRNFSRQSTNRCDTKIRAHVKRLCNNNKSSRRTSKLNTTSTVTSAPAAAATTSKTTTTKSAVTVALAQLKRKTRRKSRNCSDSGKENCWQDSGTEEITLYATDSCNRQKQNTRSTTSTANCAGAPHSSAESGDGLSNDDALNNFGPIMLNASSPSSSSSSLADKGENIKCISECDSTTDQQQAATSSSSAVTTTLVSDQLDQVDPEIDSTTDLLPVESTCVGDLSSENKPEPLVDSLNTNEIVLADQQQFDIVSNASTSVQSTNASIFSSNFAASPDLISLFDEEINRGSTDLCQYSDFFPYNSVITQALFNCNEMNQLCDQNELNSNGMSSTDITFLSSMNQTAIDNLKALTNLQTHTANFLSNMNAPNDASSSSTSTSYATSNGMTMGSDNMIHSITNTACTLYSQQQNVEQMQLTHHNMVHSQPQDQNDRSNEIQLETDECMEIEEINENQEEAAWDAFDPYIFIKHLPPLTAEMRAKCPALPLKTRSSPEFNLVLDLDETLVHCSLQELSDASFKFPVLFQVCSESIVRMICSNFSKINFNLI